MGDKNITLFALHTHGDNQFGPSSIPGGSDEEADESQRESKGKSLFGGKSSESEAPSPDSDQAQEPSDGGSAIVGLVVALVVLGGIAMVAKKLRGGKESEVDLTESDDL